MLKLMFPARYQHLQFPGEIGNRRVHGEFGKTHTSEGRREAIQDFRNESDASGAITKFEFFKEGRFIPNIVSTLLLADTPGTS